MSMLGHGNYTPHGCTLARIKGHCRLAQRKCLDFCLADVGRQEDGQGLQEE